jgi:calcineurin-like phosphoesterase family protein
MPNIWVIADTHFEHERMAEHCGRPEGYEWKILKAIGRTVRYDDILVNLGDFCWHRDAYWHEQYMLYAKCLNWLTIGNHDGKTTNWYLNHGWAWAGESRLVQFFGKRILFSHMPMPDGDYDWNVHGHFHNTDHHTQMEHEPEIVARLTPKHILVALEHTDYRPINLEALLTKQKLQKQGGPLCKEQ